jgi:hypothetical protein
MAGILVHVPDAAYFREYHSVNTVMVVGVNPNLDITATVLLPTNKRP